MWDTCGKDTLWLPGQTHQQREQAQSANSIHLTWWRSMTEHPRMLTSSQEGTHYVATHNCLRNPSLLASFLQFSALCKQQCYICTCPHMGLSLRTEILKRLNSVVCKEGSWEVRDDRKSCGHYGRGEPADSANHPSSALDAPSALDAMPHGETAGDTGVPDLACNTGNVT